MRTPIAHSTHAVVEASEPAPHFVHGVDGSESSSAYP